MPETILVIEYEPRYTDRVRQALSGQPYSATFARDGEEALQAINSQQPRLIVLSSVVPKTTTTDMIRAIREQSLLQKVPILLTVSGYAGSSPEADAQRVGATDILPKPYSDAAFLSKVQQLLGVSGFRPVAQGSTENIVRPTTAGGGLTSNDIFGDVLEEERTVVTPPKKITKSTADVDKMIADTLSGVLTPKKTAPGTPKTSPGTEPRPKTDAGRTPIDKILNDTLSGLEKAARVKSTPPAAPQAPGPTTPPPAAAAPPVAAPAPPAPAAQPKPPQPPVAATPAPAEPLRPAVPPPAPRPAQPAPAASPNGFDRMPMSQPVLTPPAAPVEEEEPTDGVKFGQYVLLEKIATGGMAEVWKARMRGVEGFQKIVAIKKILPHLSDNQDFIEMFVDEAKLAAQLSHNNIIHIYDLGKVQDSYYIAMEYVDGKDLKTILRKAEDIAQPMTVELALFVASKIAAALDYAHRRRDFDGKDLGLVHRDVSPQNVLISEEGDIKLCDFGIAKAASKASHTQAGALKGKLQYMSPEQAWGRNIDRRSDIFALAAVLFEMLTNRKLFSGENEMSILEQVREARVTKPSELNDEVTPEIDRIVLKALAKEPEDRYQSAADMARDIDQILYSFRPTPTSADLAIFMHRISMPEPAMPPQPDYDETVAVTPEPPKPAPVVELKPAAAAPAAAAVVMPAWEPEPPRQAPFAHAVEEKKKSKAPLIAVAAIVVVAAGVGGFFMMQKKSAPAPAPAAVTTTAPTATATASPVAATAAPTDTAATAAATATTGTTATIDPAKVEEEVRKRLDAEKQKLDRLATAQQTAQPAPQPAAARPVTPPVQTAQRPAPQPSQPQPAVTETHAPAPAVATSAPATETRAAAPVPAPEAPRAKEGDLVTSGEGLTPARLTRMAPVMYPPIARAQRVEGTVIVSALISETGQILDMKVVSGVNRPGGLNEAAQQTLRRSTFTPGMKDGVRVKSWTTVRVDFKL